MILESYRVTKFVAPAFSVPAPVLISFLPLSMEQASVEWIRVTLNDAREISARLIIRAFRCSVHTFTRSQLSRTKIYLGAAGGGGELNSMTFQSWEMKFLSFTTFQVFNDLYKCCFRDKICTCCSLDRPKVNLFCKTWRNSRVLGDSDIILSNQKSVFTQLTTRTTQLSSERCTVPRHLCVAGTSTQWIPIYPSRASISQPVE